MRRLSMIFSAMLVGSLAAAPALGRPTSIGLFFDAGASDCDATVAVGDPFAVYVIAVLGTDGATNGVQGAQFWVRGLEPTWMAQFVPTPAATLVLGDPLVCSVAMLFPCQIEGSVLLGTIHATMNPPATPHTLYIDGNCSPSMPDIDRFPYMIPCDAMGTRVYVAAGQAFLNGGACSVAIVPTTWTVVREMFR